MKQPIIGARSDYAKADALAQLRMYEAALLIWRQRKEH